MTYWFRLLLISIFILAAGEIARADSFLVAWDASTSSNVTGYHVYYGTNSGNYTCQLDAGNATSITISNLNCGVTYYFAATAYDANGDESPYSEEISFLVPGAFYIGPAGAGGSPATLSFSVAAGHSYEVQATTDLLNWTSIWQSAVMATNVWTQFVDPDAASFPQRFYRLVMH